eukprot:PhF_6_TR2161/c0_g1_i1/m.3518
MGYQIPPWMYKTIHYTLLIIALPIICCIRGLLHIASYYVRNYYLRNPSRISQDGHSVLHNVTLLHECIPYSSYHSREYFDVIEPSDPHQYIGDVLFVHGGGWCVAESVLLLPSLTPLSRAGYRVFLMNYPYSPIYVYPTQVNSVIRALQCMKMSYGVERCVVIGDSAGGNLATVAVHHVQHATPLSPEAGAVPDILGVVSIYGILDRTSHRHVNAGELNISHMERYVFKALYEVVLLLYTQCGAVQEDVCLSDLIPNADSYPPTLFICADKDLFIAAARKVADKMVRRGFECTLKEYDGRHAFFSWPPCWTTNEYWKRAPAMCTRDIIQFLNERYHKVSQ